MRTPLPSGLLALEPTLDFGAGELKLSFVALIQDHDLLNSCQLKQRPCA